MEVQASDAGAATSCSPCGHDPADTFADFVPKHVGFPSTLRASRIVASNFKQRTKVWCHRHVALRPRFGFRCRQVNLFQIPPDLVPLERQQLTKPTAGL